MDSLVDLESLGWDDFFQRSFGAYGQQEYVPGRISQQHRGMYRIMTAGGELSGGLSGRLRHRALPGQLPAVGDWVSIRPRYDEASATIAVVLPRKSQFVRAAAGSRTEGQIVAANVDTVFLMTGLDDDFNVRRIERYLVLAWESGAQPVVLLSKSDLCRDLERKLLEVEAASFGGAPVHVTSVIDGTGLQTLRRYLCPGKTIAVLGSSGVGKSTLINYLTGRELQKIQNVRTPDGRGRHTTTSRQLIMLPGGGLVVDTPGMRELQLWDCEDEVIGIDKASECRSGFERTFRDIESMAEQCRYRDCSHDGEPDCAVQASLSEGSLDQARFRSYQKLRKELRYQERKQDKAAEKRERNKWKKLCRAAREKAAIKRGG